MLAQIPLKRIALLGLLVTGAMTVQAATINGSVTFAAQTGGVFGNWSISFSSSDPVLELRSARFTLPAGYGFDTQNGGFGVPASQDFEAGSSLVGTTLTPGTTGGRDGANQLRIDFSGFTADKGPFLYNLDVDEPLQSLEVCQPSPAGDSCNQKNGELTLAAAVVKGAEIQGTSVFLTFGGPGYSNAVVQTDLKEIAELAADGSFAGTAVPVPEPSTYVLMGLGLAGFGLLRRRR